MPVQLNFETSVDTAAFMAFRDTFRKYREELEKAPQAWANANKASDAFRKSSDASAVALRNQATAMAEISKHTTTFHQLTTSSSRMWQTMSRSTRDVAGHIEGMTKQLLKWSGLTALIGGAAGGFGMYALGANVSTARIASMGRGMSLGGMRAVQTNYARFGDPNQLLGAIARAKFDPTDPARPGLLALGVDLNADTDVAFQQAERGLKRIADTRSPQMYTNILEGMGLGGATNYEHLENLLRGTTAAGLGEIEKKTAEDKRKMDLTPDEQRRWQDFMTQLDRAGQQIEKIFVVGLGKLTPDLKDLSASFVKFTEALFVKGGAAEQFLDKVDSGLEWLADKIDPDNFQKNFKAFSEGIGPLASAIAKFAGWLGVTPALAATGPTGVGSGGTGAAPGGGTVSAGAGGSTGPWAGSSSARGSGLSTLGGGQGMDLRGQAPAAMKMPSGQAAKNMQESIAFWKSKGLSENEIAGMLAQEQSESDFNPHGPAGDSGAAIGSFQWHAPRRAQIRTATGIDVTSSSSTHLQHLEAAQWERLHTRRAAAEHMRHARSAAEAGYIGSREFEGAGGRFGPEREGRRRGGIAERMKVQIHKTPGGNTADQMVALPAR